MAPEAPDPAKVAAAKDQLDVFVASWLDKTKIHVAFQEIGAPTPTQKALQEAQQRALSLPSDWKNKSTAEKVLLALERIDLNDSRNAAVSELLQAVSLESLGFILVAFAVAQFTPVGWLADMAAGILLAVDVGMTAAQIWDYAESLAEAITHAGKAQTPEDLDKAGKEFAEVAGRIGAQLLMMLLGGKGKDERFANAHERPTNVEVVTVMTNDNKMLMIEKSTIPEDKLAELLAAGSGSGGRGRGSDGGSGRKPPGGDGRDEGGGRRKRPAPPRDRVFVRAGLQYRMKGDGPAFEALEKMPAGSAVYLAKDSSGTVIYVGITERGWVRWGEHLAQKEGNFLGDIDTFEFIGAGYLEREAITLETVLIKEHNPKWNVDKDPYKTRFPNQPPLEGQNIPRTNMRIIFTIENVFERVP
jgi:hypothetical protein